MITKSAPYSCLIFQKRPFFPCFSRARKNSFMRSAREENFPREGVFIFSLPQNRKTRADLKLCEPPRKKITLFRRRRHATLSFPRSAVLSFIRTTIITHFPLTFKRLRKINAAFIKSPGKRLRRKIGKGRRSSLKSAAPH